jgi:quercetin dioxygenase-like cupin family protein
MERKEPYATQEDYGKYVVRYADVPIIELAPGFKTHIVSGDRITLSFVSAEPSAELPSHHHENEQIMIVSDGAVDFVIEGKQYHVEKGDVVVLPSNTEHGGYISDQGCRAIDVFSPPRQDYVAKLEKAKKNKA